MELQRPKAGSIAATRSKELLRLKSRGVQKEG